MDLYIADVNADPYVQTATGGAGLTFMLLPRRAIPIASGAMAPDLRRPEPAQPDSHRSRGSLKRRRGGDGPGTLPREPGSDSRPLALRRFGADARRHRRREHRSDERRDQRELVCNPDARLDPGAVPDWQGQPPAGGEPLDGILDVGLAYNLGGAIAHRNAFYNLAGGDKKGAGSSSKYAARPDAGRAPRRDHDDIVQAAEAPLQTLATKAKVRIEMASTNLTKTLTP